MTPTHQNVLIPIAVDLDGTLTLTDTLHESVIRLLGTSSFSLFLLFTWALRGKAALMSELSKWASINPASLPYNLEVLDWLKAEPVSLPAWDNVLRMHQWLKNLLLFIPLQTGTTLALDFPQHVNLAPLFDRLHAIVCEACGRHYPAKDAHMSPTDFKHDYPNWEQVENLRDPILMSRFWQRVTQDTA